MDLNAESPDPLEENLEDWTSPVEAMMTTSSVGTENRLSTWGNAGTTVLSRMRLDDNKAGMKGLDKDKINKIIMESSRGSKYYDNEQRKEKQILARVAQQQETMRKFTEDMISTATAKADKFIAGLEAERDLSRTIVHLDMDAFYASVEMRDDPSLREKPMAVGSTYMLSTSNYLARRYGVRAAMPGFIGKKLCPELVLVGCNFDKYRVVAEQVREILAEYDPNFCSMGLDEAYVDITEYLRRRPEISANERTFSRNLCTCDSKQLLENGAEPQCKNCLGYLTEESITFGCSAEEVTKEMRFRIELKTKLTASAGIAANTMLAKVCSDMNKPNGQFSLEADETVIKEFMRTLPIRKVSGIGKVSERMLNALGITTCGHLYDKRAVLRLLHLDTSFHHYMWIAVGLGTTVLESWKQERQSMSVERTFGELSKPAELYAKCEELCQSLSDDLQEEKLLGKTVTLKLKLVDFTVRTRASSLANYTNDYGQIVQTAQRILRGEIQSAGPQPLRLRLMGVRMSNLCEETDAEMSTKQATITSLFSKVAPAVAGPDSKTSVATAVTDAGCQSRNDDNSRNPEEAARQYKCPICGKAFEALLRDFNRHVAACPTSAAFRSKSKHAKKRNGIASASDSNSASANSESSRTAGDADAEEESDRIKLDLTVNATFFNKSHLCDGEEPQQKRTVVPPVHSEMDRDEGGGRAFVCPVCSRAKTNLSLHEFNSHVDDCLSKQEIKTLLSEDLTVGASCSTKKRKSDDKRPNRGPLDSFVEKKVRRS